MGCRSLNKMYCPKCGKKIDNNSNFCPKCGFDITGAVAKKNENKPNNTVVEVSEPVVIEEVTVATSKPTKSLLRYLKIVLIVISLIVIGVLAFAFYPYIINPAKITIDLNPYLLIEQTGNEYAGSFDEIGFEKDYLGKIKYSSSSVREYGISDDEDVVHEFVKDCVNGSVNANAELKNGDTVTYEWNCNTDLAKEKYNVILVCENKSETVAGLLELQEVDPFEYIELEFYNDDEGYGRALIVENPDGTDICKNINYVLSKNSYLKNGDSITVTATPATSSEYIRQQFNVIIPEESTKEYLVSGLEEMNIVTDQSDAQTLGSDYIFTDDFHDVRDISTYKRYNGGFADFAFSYPSTILKESAPNTNDNEKWGNIKETKSYKSLGNTTADFCAIEISEEQSQDMLSLADAIYEDKTSAITDCGLIADVNMEDYSRRVITGYDSKREYIYYTMINVEKGYIMLMELKYPVATSETDEAEKRYFVECMYRLCDFGNYPGPIRTYEEFVDNKDW